MPRIHNEKYQRKYQETDLYDFLDGKRREQKKTEAYIGLELDVDQSTISRAIKNRSLSTLQLISFADLLGYKIVAVPKEVE